MPTFWNDVSTWTVGGVIRTAKGFQRCFIVYKSKKNHDACLNVSVRGGLRMQSSLTLL